ncbi:MAG: hypothetical protein HPY74_02865 [Firmicutes bacterium]|nr:hypothetical protein [Bacillota bacterium]
MDSTMKYVRKNYEKNYVQTYLNSNKNKFCTLILLILIRTIICVLFMYIMSGCEKIENPDESTINVLPEGWYHFEKQNEFSCILADENIVLAGGTEGLFKKNKEENGFSIMLNNKRKYEMVRSIMKDSRGLWWIGHQDGISIMIENEVVHITMLNDKKIGQVTSFMEDKDGNIYCGTYNGAWRIGPGMVNSIKNSIKTGINSDNYTKAGDIKLITTADGLLHDMVNVMFCDSRGFLWFGSYTAKGGGITNIKNDRIKTFDILSGLLQNYITSITEDGDGKVWVGSGVYTSGGANVFSYTGKEYILSGALKLEDGLAGDKVRHIYFDVYGNGWFCSEYDGIAIFNREERRIYLLTDKNGLSDNEVKDICPDTEGNLWLACRRGITYIPAEWLQKELAGFNEVLD